MKPWLVATVMASIAWLSVWGSQSPHVHGEAQLRIIVAPSRVSMSLTVPGMSLVGFERQPRTPSEHQQIEHVRQQWAQTNWFQFHQKTGWLRREHPVDATQLDTQFNHTPVAVHDTHHDDHGHHHDHHAEPEPHVEFTLRAEYAVPTSAVLSSISTDLFSTFNGITRMMVTVITDDHQSHHVVDATHPSIPIPTH
tara:strand:- start:302 stop:886 length:585 start_codon:yes stop_codon:yes gene_type:complete